MSLQNKKGKTWCIEAVRDPFWSVKLLCTFDGAHSY